MDAQLGVTSAAADEPVEASAEPTQVVAGARRRSINLPVVMACYPPPAGGPANVTLHLSATDDVSGVGSVMISNRADFLCAAWQTYAARMNWYVPGGRTTIYVKFRDNAGNVSPIVTDTVTR